MSNSDYNKWKIELENNKNRIIEINRPQNAQQNIELNMLINRCNLLINLIKNYDDYQLRQDLSLPNQSRSSQQAFNYSHPMDERVEDDLNLIPSNNPYDFNPHDPYNAAALSSPRKNEKTGNEKTGGKVKVYTGPKNGKYIIKNGAKVYIDSKSLSNNVQYIKKAKSKKK
jgi:hypothetical protein